MTQAPSSSNGETAAVKLDQLRQTIATLGSAMVCFSGGVDSAFLLAVTHEVLGERAIAFTAQSPSLPKRELDQAQAFTSALGVRHIVLSTDELADRNYAKNPANRCYFCKSALLTVATSIAREQQLAAILLGTNHNDLGEHRPGLKAAGERGAHHPLAEVGLTKQEIRQLSKERGLVTWDKPEMACLASRFPYGTEITAARLDQVDRFEAGLAELGFHGVRVRYHQPIARLEMAPDVFAQVVEPATRDRIVALGRSCGFSYVALDLAGYRRGALNEMLPADQRGPSQADVTQAIGKGSPGASQSGT